MPKKKFNAESYNDVTVVSVYLSRATIEYASEFKSFLMEIINNNASKILIDIKFCTFMDSAFLGALVHCLKQGRSKNCDLRLLSNDQMQSSIFLLTEFRKIFSTYTDINEAILSFELDS